MTIGTTPAGPATAGVDTTTVASTPYPWPYHGRFDPARCALLACLDRSWRPSGPDSDAADARLGGLAAELSAVGVAVVAVTSTPRRRGGPNPAGLESPDTSPAGTPLAAHYTLSAGGTSAFHASPLDDLLRGLGVSELIITGWGLEGPVHSTMRAANDRGYECLLVADASIASRPELTGAACSMVEFSGGIFGAVAVTENVTASLSPEPGGRLDPD